MTIKTSREIIWLERIFATLLHREAGGVKKGFSLGTELNEKSYPRFYSFPTSGEQRKLWSVHHVHSRYLKGCTWNRTGPTKAGLAGWLLRQSALVWWILGKGLLQLLWVIGWNKSFLSNKWSVRPFPAISCISRGFGEIPPNTVRISSQITKIIPWAGVCVTPNANSCKLFPRCNIGRTGS